MIISMSSEKVRDFIQLALGLNPLASLTSSTETEDQTSMNTQKADEIIDSVFSVVYFVCFVVILAISTKNFLTFKSSVNMSNIAVVTLLLCVLLNRLLCLLYSLLVI